MENFHPPAWDRRLALKLTSRNNAQPGDSRGIPDMQSDRSLSAGSILTALLGLLLLTCSACDTVGVIASRVVGEEDIPASYTDLKGQQVGVLVWADAGIVIDHPRIFADLAGSLQNKLQQAKDAGVSELKGTQLVPTNRILQFQDAHPESQSDSAEQIALKLPVSRLIYIEVASLSIHPNNSLDLSRGEAVANVKVVSVTNGKSKTVYENDNITGVYPPNSPPEGMPGLEDETVYHKSIDNLTTELAKLFIPHPPEPDQSPSRDTLQ
jgi:hypothetical protein